MDVDYVPVQGQIVVPPISDHNINKVPAAPLLLQEEQPFLLGHRSAK